MSDERIVEDAFQKWYAERAAALGLNPNPDDPQHFYDYRAAFRAGAEPDQTGHWPSQFKLEGHPRMVIDGVNTKTGEPVAPQSTYFNSPLSPRKPTRSSILAAQEDDPYRAMGVPRPLTTADVESAGALTSGMAGSSVGGLAGIFGGGADVVPWWQNELTYQPRSQAGQQALEVAGLPMEGYVQGVGPWPGTAQIGAKMSDVFGPAVGAGTRALLEVAPGEVFKGAGRGTVLVGRGMARAGAAGVRGAEAAIARAAEAGAPATFAQAGAVNPKGKGGGRKPPAPPAEPAILAAPGEPVPAPATEPALLAPTELPPPESAILAARRPSIPPEVERPPVDPSAAAAAAAGAPAAPAAPAAPLPVVPVKPRRIGTTGQVAGAPLGIDSPQKLSALINHYVNTMRNGLLGRDFYTESSGDVLARAGGDVPNVADPFTGNLAILSRSNQVGGNASMSAKGHIQAVTGARVNTGRFPSKDSEPVAELYRTLQRMYAGLKRDPFADQLAVAWDPTRIGRGVNDMHEAEIMGYPSGQVGGPAQHAFMDWVRHQAIARANKMKLGGFNDWNTGNAQAAAWTGNKIRRGDIEPGDAARDYSTYLPDQEMNITYESFPGVGSGHLPNAPVSDFAAKLAFHNDPAGTWSPETAATRRYNLIPRDIGYTAARFLPGPDVTGRVGRFTPEGGKPEVNPVTIPRPIVGTKTAPEVEATEHFPGIPRGNPTIPESALDAVNLIEGARAVWDVQNASGGHKIYPSKKEDYTGVTWHIPGLDEAKMNTIAPIFEAKGYYLATAPEGITVITNETTPKGEAFYKEVHDLLKQAGYKRRDLKLDFGRIETSYNDFTKAWRAGQNKGVVISQLLELVRKAPETARLLEMDPDYREAVVSRNARDLRAEAQGWGPPRADEMRARQIFDAGGWAGLRDAVHRGLVPMAAALTIGGTLLAGQDERPSQ